MEKRKVKEEERKVEGVMKPDNRSAGCDFNIS